jgi:pimeloyl-ACP methyl ester carboxylesterase
MAMRGANWWNWLGFTWGWRWAPVKLVGWVLGRSAAGRLDLSDDERLHMYLRETEGMADGKDSAIVRDEGFARLYLRSAREAFAQGYEGLCGDARLMCVDFGFRIEHVRAGLPVLLWYGREDTCVPIHHGEQIAARLGGRGELRVLDETHASIWMNQRRAVLQAILGLKRV